ncbi:MAG: NUDIX domain-containing protein [Balneola sp.]|nr:NUDIX domain-containing protein [Balneola sp.]|tara:strand:+ start:2555 stop:3202 length:648 start_codon:yes stop_codon:yes gene_type:complete
MKKTTSHLSLNGHLAEQKKHSEKVFSGELLQVFKDEVILPNASIGRREWIQHPGACAVVPVFSNGDCVLIQQFRYPAQQLFWEVPAGKIDPDEDPLSTACRELEEETGYCAEEWFYIGHFYPAIGYADEIIHIYLAQGLIQGEQNMDQDEFLRMYRVPFDEAISMIHNGEINDAKTIASIIRAHDFLNRKKSNNELVILPYKAISETNCPNREQG